MTRSGWQGRDPIEHCWLNETEWGQRIKDGSTVEKSQHELNKNFIPEYNIFSLRAKWWMSLEISQSFDETGKWAISDSWRGGDFHINFLLDSHLPVVVVIAVVNDYAFITYMMIKLHNVWTLTAETDFVKSAAQWPLVERDQIDHRVSVCHSIVNIFHIGRLFFRLFLVKIRI